MNRKGMTLLELIVYIALGAFLLAPVIILVQRSSFFVAKDSVVSSLRHTGKDIVQIMLDDLKNTGYKTEITDNSGSITIEIREQVSVSTTDSSSFIFSNGTTGPYDELTVIMGRQDNNMAWDGIDTITYLVENNNLLRILNDGTGPDTLTIAFDIDALQFQFSEDLDTWHNSFADDDLKKDIRYIRAHVLIRNDRTLANRNQQTYEIADLTGGNALVFSDNRVRELYQITIPIPNNGVFD